MRLHSPKFSEVFKAVLGDDKFLLAFPAFDKFLNTAMLRSLTDTLAGPPKRLAWSTTMEAAFVKAKQKFANAALLAQPVKGMELWLLRDARACEIGAAAHRIVRGQEQPPVFYSGLCRNLHGTQHGALEYRKNTLTD